MATIGTRLMTWLSGQLVGQDQFGNRYYRARARKGYERERRWVIYQGEDEASRVPPEWHAWLHYTEDQPLDDAGRWPWQREHQPNMTGTAAAYRPPGCVLGGGRRERGTGDYEPWRPQ